MSLWERSSGALVALMLCPLALQAAPSGPWRDRILSSDPAVHAEALKALPSLTADEKLAVAQSLQGTLDSTALGAQQAAEALALLGPSAYPALSKLVSALHFDEETTAKPVEDALVAIGSKAVTPVRAVLGDSNYFVRRRATEVLGRLGPQAKAAAPALVQLLNDAQYDVNSAAQAALIQIGEPAIPAVLVAFHSEKNEQSRASYLELLGKLGPAASPILVQSLGREESSFVRAAAAQSLSTLQPVPPDAVGGLIIALSDFDDHVREAVVTALTEIGPHAKPAIGALIQSSVTDGEALVRQGATDALTAIGPITSESLPGLTRALRSPNAEVHEAVMNALANAKVPFSDAQPVLTAALSDSSPAIRAKAIIAAGRLGSHNPAAVPMIRSALTDQNDSVRAAATKALAQAEDQSPDANAVLQNALKGNDPSTRQAAVKSLGQLGVASIPTLVPVLKDSNKDVASEASRAIVNMGPTAIPALEKYADDPDPILKTRTAELIAMIRRSTPAKIHRKSSS